MILAILLAAAAAFAGRPSGKTDTLSVSRSSGKISSFKETFRFTATTTPDTCTAIAPGSYAEVVNHGASGAGVLVSWSQAPYSTQFSDSTVGGHDAVRFSSGSSNLLRVIVKAVSTSAVVAITIKN
jgi:hypothetical protein